MPPPINRIIDFGRLLKQPEHRKTNKRKNDKSISVNL